MTDLQTPSTVPAKTAENPKKSTKYLVSEVMEAFEVAEAIAGGRIDPRATVRVELAFHSATGAKARQAAIKQQARAEFRGDAYDFDRTYSAVAETNYEDWSPGEPKIEFS